MEWIFFEMQIGWGGDHVCLVWGGGGPRKQEG